MATKRDLEEINRQYPSGPDGLKVGDLDGAMRSVQNHPWGAGTRSEPSGPWPEREPYEEDHRYLIRMVRQLFVEMAEIQAKLDKPLYQITMPPPGIDPYFGVPTSRGPMGEAVDPLMPKEKM